MYFQRKSQKSTKGKSNIDRQKRSEAIQLRGKRAVRQVLGLHFQSCTTDSVIVKAATRVIQ